jgi:predicted dehydrogenase
MTTAAVAAAAARRTANIAVIGSGWWSQGWHLPHLHRNKDVKLAAIVDSSTHPKSPLNPSLEPLSALSALYQAPTFSSVTDLLESELGPTLDGVLVATPHATHYEIGELLLKEARRRKEESPSDHRPMNVLMEKPMTTNVHEAKGMLDLVESYQDDGGKGCFLINHSANYREQCKVARELIVSGAIGGIRHVTGFMASPLSFIFDDPANTGWNEPSDSSMLGNGFSWGQCSHLLAWIFHVCPNLLPHHVFCVMNESKITGADVSHSASVICSDVCGTNDVILSMSGTSMLPGNVHSDPAVGKILRIKIFGTEGSILYSGNDDQDPSSGQLELRRVANNGNVELPCGPGFYFESLSQEGTGPESLQSFIDACLGKQNYYAGADAAVGLRTVQILEAMYRSNASRKLEDVLYSDST